VVGWAIYDWLRAIFFSTDATLVRRAVQPTPVVNKATAVAYKSIAPIKPMRQLESFFNTARARRSWPVPLAPLKRPTGTAEPNFFAYLNPNTTGAPASSVLRHR